ncbi:MAG TPA: hypothetical protein DC000_00120 [Clostridiales bacterium]|nr:hypothetical protein [Clostridiales bacterium]
MYNMYLIQETDEETLVLKIPELPDDIEIKGSYDNKKSNVLNLGEIIRVGKKNLESFTLKSFFPASDADVYVKIFNKMLENMSEKQYPIRYILNRTDGLKLYDDINMLVVCDDYSYKESGGEVGDIYYTFKFTQYKEHKARVIGSV